MLNVSMDFGVIDYEMSIGTILVSTSQPPLDR